ncbi:MAG: sensor histidine kinase [Betaproteobacteria bacterium]
MLQRFLTDNRRELVARCRLKAERRSMPMAGAVRLEHGIPVFLDQLIVALGPANAPSSPAEALARREMGLSATRHGAELLRNHFTIDQVVHDYGDLCQAIMELAAEQGIVIEVAEFQVLNQALDNAISDAVTEFAAGSAGSIAGRNLRTETERLGQVTQELRNQVDTATLALTAIKAGNVGLFGATGAVLDRSIIGLRKLIYRSLMEVRATPSPRPRLATFSLADFIRDVATTATLDARFAECAITVAHVDPRLALRGDRDLLASAVGILLQNAFRFSHEDGEVSLYAHAGSERILIEVADSCGGLPNGMADEMLRPVAHRSGRGPGLSLVQRSVETNGGLLGVRDAPPVGCVVTVDLPRFAL